MTNKEKKQWLRRVMDADEYIHDLQKSYQEVLDMATSITPRYDGEGGSGDPNPHKFDKVAEYAERVERAINQLAEEKAKVYDAVDQLPDVTLKRVMTLRYLRGMKWERIADEMCYSKRNVTILHGKALTLLNVPEE